MFQERDGQLFFYWLRDTFQATDQDELLDNF